MLTIGFSITFAQDIINMRNGQQIQSRVINIGSAEVQYQLFQDPSNKVVTVSTDKIESIRFENGTTRTFEAKSKNQTKGRKAKQDATDSQATSSNESDAREYTFTAATYFAEFDKIGNGCYGLFSHSLKDCEFNISLAFPIMNFGISKNKYSDIFGGALGINYCYGLNDNACAYAPLMFIGYSYKASIYDNKSGKLKDKDKFGWGFMLSPSVLYKTGHFAVTVGPNFMWTKGSGSKFSVGFQAGVGYAW